MKFTRLCILMLGLATTVALMSQTTGLPAPSANGLNGVSTPSPSAGYLFYNGSAFVYQTPASGGTVDSGTIYSPAYYIGTGTTVGGVIPFTGLGYWSTSAAPSAATSAEVQSTIGAGVYDVSGAAAARAAVGTCAANEYASATTTSGVTCAQVAYSQVSGTPTIPTSANWPNAGTCTAGEYADSLVNGSGPTCAQVLYSQLGGTVPTWNQSTTGNAATATALASAPAQCGSGDYSTGITASGTANCAQVAYSQISGTPAIPTPSEVTASGATPAFSPTATLNTITLAASVTSSTLASGTAGFTTTPLICENATGGYTFVWPTNLRGAMTISTGASKCNSQTFVYSSVESAWIANSSGVANE